MSEFDYEMEELNMAAEESDKKLAELSLMANRLRDFSDRLEQNVCVGGLWERVHECQSRGMSGTFYGTTMRTYNMAGRVMLTLERGEASVTYVGADYHNSVEYKRPIRIGFHSFEGSFERISGMITDILDGWPKLPDSQREVFKSDDTLNIGV